MEGTRRRREVIGNINEPQCRADTVHVSRLQMKTPLNGNAVLDMAALRKPEV